MKCKKCGSNNISWTLCNDCGYEHLNSKKTKIMKTPIQEIYDNFNLMSDADFKAWMLNTDLLKKEKEVIITSHINGQSEFDKGARRDINDKYAEQYFNQTFNTEEK